MIILCSKKIKSNLPSSFQEQLKVYSETLNYGPLQCPHCHSSNVIRWGSYERNVIFFSENQYCLQSQLLTVQRIKCKSCNKTHALLPKGIIPYKQMASEVVISGLIATINHNTSSFIDKYGINESILKRNYKDFLKFHLSRLKVMFSNNSILESLHLIKNNTNLQMDYITNNNCCFMQIKLGIIGVMPLLRGAPT